MVLCCLAASLSLTAGESVRWSMLNIMGKKDVADCHVIRMPSGATILIDAGLLADSPGAVVNALKARKIQSIDLAIISHFHIDHYGALLDVHDAGIPIARVVGNVPDKAAAQPEAPWGCSLPHVHYTLDELRRRGIPFSTPKIGERVWEERTAEGTDVALDAVCLFDGLNTPIGRTDVNDTSIILRLSVGATRALFTGDLNHSLGTFLAQSDFDLAADVLKVPHHGIEGAAPNSFFERVGASAALVPTPRHHWESPRAARIRGFFAERQIPAYVSGLHGDVTVTLTGQGYEIETER
jgi:competence protein ComEC